MQSQDKELNKNVQILSQQNEVLLKRIRSLETEYERTKKKSHALEGIAMLAEAAKNL